jgi:trigger factor
MKSIVEKTENNKVKITITVDAETFEKANHSAYLKSRSKINVPGFRKGKAPKAVILQRYGEGVFYEDAFDEVFPVAYQEAILEHDIKPVERPAIDILEIGKEGVKFTCEVTVMPEVKLGDYKGVEVEVPEYKVTEKDVNAQIDREREKIARWVEVERKVEKGDRANINYKGFVDDVAFEGGEAEGHDLEIGSGSFIPGFEDQVIGMEKGETKDIMVTFPTEYHSEDLKGKEAKFVVTVNDIKEKELPELDDEYAKDVSEFDTFDEYKNDISKKLQEKEDAW